MVLQISPTAIIGPAFASSPRGGVVWFVTGLRSALVPIFAELFGDNLRIGDIHIKDVDRTREAAHACDEVGGEIGSVKWQIAPDKFGDMRGILRE